MTCYDRTLSPMRNYGDQAKTWAMIRDRKVLAKLTSIRSIEPRRLHRHMQWYAV